MDVVWDGKSDGSRDEAGSWVRGSVCGRDNLGMNVGHMCTIQHLYYK